MNIDRLTDKFDRALDVAPCIIIWFVVIVVTASIASQTYMWSQRRAHAGPERASAVVAGSGLYALD